MTDALREALEKRGRKWGDMNHTELPTSGSHPGTKPRTQLTTRVAETDSFAHVGAYVTRIHGAE